jgi:hypothetical protein
MYKIHVSNWTRVFLQYTCPIGRVYFYNTRVQLDTCILYTRPIGVFIQLATVSKRHVASWTHVYSNRYCRHASNCRVFCSEGGVMICITLCPPILYGVIFSFGIGFFSVQMDGKEFVLFF